MQPVPAIEAQLAEARNQIVVGERRLSALRAAKALESMTDAERAELKQLRVQLRDDADEVTDLEAGLQLAKDYEQSEAGKQRRADAVAAVLRTEAVGIAMREAAAAEDAAGQAYEQAMSRRVMLQNALGEQAKQVATLLQPVPDLRPASEDERRASEAMRSAAMQRFSDQLSLLGAAAESGLPAATAWRLARLIPPARGMLALGPGVHFDAQARITVAGAATAALAGFLLRLGSLLQAAGISMPAQRQDATREHAARIVAAMAEDTASRPA